MENIQLDKITEQYVIPWSIDILLALMIFIIGRYVAKLITRLITKLLERAKVETILVHFIAGIVNSILLVVVIIAALDQLGVQTTSFIAVLGAAGLAIGLALQSSLQNFAAGVMLLLFRPFKAGDFVEAAGIAGSVENITIFSTLIKTGDNRMITVPNGSIYGNVITNYSALDTRRVDMVFGIGYEDDIKKAKEIMQQVLDADDRIMKEPAPKIAVSELADSSVNFIVRPWVKTADYWSVKFDITERMKLAFDKQGISIPYPQVQMHVESPAA